MGQVTIYLDSGIEEKMKAVAKSSNLSVSKWVAGIIKEKVAAEWSPEFIELIGCWGDEFPTIEELRANSHQDCPRELW